MTAKSDGAGEQRFGGLGVSPGIAIGPAHVVEPGAIEVPTYGIDAGDVDAERARFARAVSRARKQVEKLRAKAATLPGSAAEELGYLLNAHAQMLADSRLVRGVERRISEERINAEAAVAEELAQIAQAFADMEDDYLAARIQDIRDVGGRILRSLMKVPYQAFSDLPEGSVIIAEELTPADTAQMDPARIGGMATALGGPQGHAAIMARSLGLPAVTGVPDLIHKVRTGDRLVIDGTNGRVVTNPDPKTLAHYQLRRAEMQRRKRQLGRLRSLPAVTRDKVLITLKVNIELPGELKGALDAGAEGVGLLRTEFMYMNRDRPPSEDEQYALLRPIVEGMDGRTVTLRTLDVGSDKLAYSLADHIVDSTNPALGLRAIRLSLKVPSLLETQLAAMLRAGAHGPVRILLPMIGTVAEVRKVRELLRKVVRRLQRRRAAIADPPPPLGAMIEVPAAALAADSLARVCDFFSIGTNDLTQYTLAMDRGNAAVAAGVDGLHPAVLRLIGTTCDGAAKHDTPVGVCGALAADRLAVPILLGLGVTELSVPPARVAAIKALVGKLDLARCRTVAGEAMELPSAAAVRAHITQMLQEIGA
ncbi:MAG: phosphoenolpyruvate--protein phosphotransferase [Proteobacteria bacterium]|nr:phosphoenolpyruvate--protein phosphotransferase [Pseudomonadota bacterium]